MTTDAQQGTPEVPRPIQEGLKIPGITPEQQDQIDEVFELRQGIQNLLQSDGRRTDVVGDQIELIVSNTSVETVINNRPYYARAYRESVVVQESDGDLEPKTIVGILFDETPNLPVVTKQYKLATISEDGLLRVGKDGEEINDPKDVAFLSSLVDQLQKKYDFNNGADARQLQESRARQDAEALARRRGERRATIIKRAVGSIATVGLVVGAVSGCGAFIKSGGFEFDTTTFDKKHLAPPPGGTVLSIGQTAAVHFSETLVGNNALSRKHVPDAAAIKFGSGRLRDMIITSSQAKDDKNCVKVKYDSTPPVDSHIVLWTDFADPTTGKSRAAQLFAKNTLEYVKVCWKGQELNDNDDPRILIRY